MRDKTQILVASEHVSDAVLVRSLLQDEFRHVAISADPHNAVVDFETHRPDVLILAFGRLEKAEAYCLGLHRLSRQIQEVPHSTIVLCHKDELRKVYDLCRTKTFDDYVLFWPLGHDATRLHMAVHHALRLKPELTARTASGAPADGSSRLPLVLAVDDDLYQHRLLGHLLADAGIQLQLVTSAADAFASLAERRADLVLMDVDLPDVDGLEATRRMKSSPDLSAIPVIMVTAHKEKEIVVESLAAGAVDFVVKPFDRAVLLDKMRKALSAT